MKKSRARKIGMTPLDILRDKFNHTAFRGCQEQIIERVLAGGHALVIMPTGMGKSLCYQIPALLGQDLTVVISPLIALMKDQVDALRAKAIEATFINSSLGKVEREKRMAGVRSGKVRLLYVTPERFRKAAFLDCLKTRTIGLLAVDEAHCISSWGHDFRPDYSRLAEIRSLIGNPTTMALTATATPRVQDDIVRQLGLRPEDVARYHEGIARPNLGLAVETVFGDEEKLEQIQRIRKAYPGSGIVYFSLIRTLERFSELLKRDEVPHLCYHGRLDPASRKSIQNRFMGEPDRLVLATNAFGMGIDKPDIRFVTHAEVPGSMEAYYQEIGRAGRDGAASLCTLLYDQDDLLTQMEFIKWSNPEADYYQRVFDIIHGDAEKVSALGMPWLKQQLHAKQARHDFRVETALGMLERFGVIEGTWDDERIHIEVVGELASELTDSDFQEEKRTEDLKKLQTLVEYVRHDGDRKAFIHAYFGLPYAGA